MQIVITGTTQGLGRALAEQYKNEGVIAINRSQTEHATEVLCDLSDKASVEAARQALNTQLTSNEVLFVLNAGTYGDDETIRVVEPQALGQLVYTNVFSQLGMVEYLLAEGRHVKLVAISSSMGSITEAPESYHYAYSVSKAALNLSIRLLAKASKRLDYIIFDPGWMRTRMGGEGATEDPTIVARNIHKLAAEQGNWNRIDGMIEANTQSIVSW